jgi:hypothetical protein
VNAAALTGSFDLLARSFLRVSIEDFDWYRRENCSNVLRCRRAKVAESSKTLGGQRGPSARGCKRTDVRYEREVRTDAQ